MSDENGVTFRNENRDVLLQVAAGESRQINNLTSRAMAVTVTTERGSEVTFTAIAGSTFSVAAEKETLTVETESGDTPPTIESAKV